MNNKSQSTAHLIALWNDGIAAEEDPGVTTTLTLPGFAGQAAFGMDPVHSLLQPLNTYDQGQALVIPNLRVKDYVLFFRVAPYQKAYLPLLRKTAAGYLLAPPPPPGKTAALFH